tara:strand:+ start:713 stop:928 length:216 start_codon:yes stop_codon:yes gene_type:complete
MAALKMGNVAPLAARNPAILIKRPAMVAGNRIRKNIIAGRSKKILSAFPRSDFPGRNVVIWDAHVSGKSAS